MRHFGVDRHGALHRRSLAIRGLTYARRIGSHYSLQGARRPTISLPEELSLRFEFPQAAPRLENVHQRKTS